MSVSNTVAASIKIIHQCVEIGISRSVMDFLEEKFISTTYGEKY